MSDGRGVPPASDFSFFDLYHKEEEALPSYDFIVYTDGGYWTSIGRGACAYVVLDGSGERLISLRSLVIQRQTSQRAELRAIVEALDALPQGSKVLIRTDSRYAISVLGRSLSHKRRYSNTDLISVYHIKRRQKQLSVRFEWVRAHSGDSWNEYCDGLCIETAEL